MYRAEDARRYAGLAINQGIHVQKGQTLLIRAQVDCVEFVRLLTEEAYRAGASDVQVFFTDTQVDRLRYQYAPQEVLDNPAGWMPQAQADYLEKGGCVISLTSADPDAFLGLDMGRVGRGLNAAKVAAKPFREQVDKGENQWLVLGVPSPGWAQKAFSQDGPERAVEKLWDAIYHTMRLDEADAAGAWEAHSRTLREQCGKLNGSGVVSLRLKNALGTDLALDLVDAPVWEGGSSQTTGGVSFHANMPTEEVFSAPHRDRVNGTVYSSMPLNYQGTLIEGMRFTFRDGVVVAGERERPLRVQEVGQPEIEAEQVQRLGEGRLKQFVERERRRGDPHDLVEDLELPVCGEQPFACLPAGDVPYPEHPHPCERVLFQPSAGVDVPPLLSPGVLHPEVEAGDLVPGTHRGEEFPGPFPLVDERHQVCIENLIDVGSEDFILAGREDLPGMGVHPGHLHIPIEHQDAHARLVEDLERFFRLSRHRIYNAHASLPLQYYYSVKVIL